MSSAARIPDALCRSQKRTRPYSGKRLHSKSAFHFQAGRSLFWRSLERRKPHVFMRITGLVLSERRGYEPGPHNRASQGPFL